MIYLGNNKLGSLYLGSAKISEAYLGSAKIFSSAPAVQYPYLLFKCDGYNGSHPNVSSTWTQAGGQCQWIQVSSSPNVWKLDITHWGWHTSLGWGLLFLFSSNEAQPIGIINHSCSLIGSGNMDVALDGLYCESMDRMFANCTGLEYIEPIHCTRVVNVGGMFSGCTNVEDGALDQYNWFDMYGVNIANHSSTFTNCGSNTASGLADLNQIPVGWGGNLAPASTLMTSSVGRWKNRNDVWRITANGPDWTSMNGVYIFTESSVSSFAGVSMNRSRISKFNGLSTTSSDALYFYPCFMQHTSTEIVWAVTTGSPNGNLVASQSNTDMPGTLDYSTYGPFEYEFGTYSDVDDVYFCFLVTNYPIDDIWFDLHTEPYGVLYNSNFKADAGLRWFR